MTSPDSSNRIREAQAVVQVARTTVAQMTENGARVKYMPGIVFSHAGSYECSAYVGASGYLTTNISVEAGMFLNSGDYVVVASMDSFNWIDQILPTSLYSKMSIDVNSRKIYLGSGGSSPSAGTGDYGQFLASGGADGEVFWYGGGTPLFSVVTLSTGEYVSDQIGSTIGVGT